MGTVILVNLKNLINLDDNHIQLAPSPELLICKPTSLNKKLNSENFNEYQQVQFKTKISWFVSSSPIFPC